MRRSLTIKLTLLPMLASAALAYADPPGMTAPLPPDAPPSAQLVPDPRAFMPPGMTPPIQQVTCAQDPDQPDCRHGVIFGAVNHGVVRGGFGHYFGTGGG